MSILHFWRKKPDHSLLTPDNLYRHSTAALDWVRQSVAATGYQGSAHSFSPLFGWAKAYPETTGYLIETLFDYARLRQDASLRDLAFGCGEWLLTQQLPSGAFPGLLAGNRQPSVFNTAQILFGLTRCIREGATNAPDMHHALLRAVQWLLSVQAPDGLWHTAAYVPGFVPTYYTRAVWGVLYANTELGLPEADQAMQRALSAYTEQVKPDGLIRDWGFYPGKPAFTHTIAYTLEGFLACGMALQREDVMTQTRSTVDILLENRRVNGGYTAGAYKDHEGMLQGDYSFLCLTGNAQLSIVCSRLYQINGARQYREAAERLLAEILPYHRLHGPAGIRGGLAGSAPVWGPYLRLRYPNWAVKFLLDSMLLLL